MILNDIRFRSLEYVTFNSPRMNRDLKYNSTDFTFYHFKSAARINRK